MTTSESLNLRLFVESLMEVSLPAHDSRFVLNSRKVFKARTFKRTSIKTSQLADGFGSIIHRELPFDSIDRNWNSSLSRFLSVS